MLRGYFLWRFTVFLYAMLVIAAAILVGLWLCTKDDDECSNGFF